MKKQAAKKKVAKTKRAKKPKALPFDPTMMRTFGPPETEETIVERVMNERNPGGGFMSKETVEDFKKNTQVVHESPSGTIRIEGEVTPAKLAAAQSFAKIFDQAVGEVMDLAAYTPDESTLAFVKGQSLSQAQIDEIKAAPAWSTFKIGNETLMKTQDNKLENVKNYCYRLERAVLSQISIRKQEIAKLENVMSLKDEELRDLRNSNAVLKRELGSFKNALRVVNTEVKKKSEEGLVEKVGLHCKTAYDSLKSALLNLISK